MSTDNFRSLNKMDQETALLAAAARQGEITAFGRLVEKYKGKAYYFALGLTGDHEDALDISQNAFVKAFRGIRKLRSSEYFPGWFFSILRNEAADFLKKRSRSRSGITGGARPIEEDSDPDTLDQPKADLERAVWRAIRSLPLELEEIIILQHFQNLDYNEISLLLGIPRGSVASRLYRARAALKKKLEGLF